ncbi:MAG: hypothetical protein ACI9R3_002587 [Verrucomicrobiales bacterium]
MAKKTTGETVAVADASRMLNVKEMPSAAEGALSTSG